MTAAGTADRPGWGLAIPWDTSVTGGVSQVVLNLAESLARHGAYRPIVIVQDWAAARPRREMRDGILHVFVRLRAAPDAAARPLRRLLHPLLAWKESLPLHGLMREFNIAVMNVHYPTLEAEALALGPRCAGNAKIIFSLHGLDIREIGRRGADNRRRYVRMLAAGQAVVAVSNSFANTVATDLAPEIAGKLSVIHNGVSAGMLCRDHRAAELPSRYILNVGTFEEKKGQRYLLAAFAAIAADYPDLRLVMAGRPADALDALVEQRRRLGLTERVVMLQNVPHREMGALFASATLFCSSSLMESFAIAPLEAGLFSLPVVACKVDGIAEVIRDGTDGLLVEPRDPARLAAAFRAMLDHPARSRAMADSLHRRVTHEFTWEAAAERYVALAAAIG